jgi:hypothetical protein
VVVTGPGDTKPVEQATLAAETEGGALMLIANCTDQQKLIGWLTQETRKVVKDATLKRLDILERAAKRGEGGTAAK